MTLMETPAEFEACAQRLKAVADPDRLKLLSLLFQGPSNVGDLADRLKVDIVKVSHHLGVLRHAGIVQTEKQGRFVIYRLHPAVVPALPSARGGPLPQIDFGCCKVDLNGPNSPPPS